jgi:SAM-dependent methyltransferase
MNITNLNHPHRSNCDSMFRWDAEQFTQKILSISRFSESDFVIDVGCGSGSFEQGLARRNGFYVGIDIAPDDNWKRYNDRNCQFIVCDARHMPFVNKAFDDALSKDMLHHTNQPRQVLLEIMRVTSRRIVIFEPNRYNPIMFVHMTALLGHAHFKQGDFESLVRSVDQTAIFSTAEAHVLPSRPLPLAVIMKFIFGCLEKSRLGPIHSYNIALVNLPREFVSP